MSRIFIHGLGAVSPAGWGVPALSAALKNGAPLAVQDLPRPGWEKPLKVRTIPAPPERPAFLAHPRLRRAGTMSHHLVAAALEALGPDVARIQTGEIRLGVIVGMMAGSVTYSRRFYEDILRAPATASPLVFPETVFNAPASHLSAFLNSPTANYTLVGDDGIFLQGVAMAADWLESGRADACLVAGVEEMDWIVANAVRLFKRDVIYSGGAGALYLKKEAAGAGVELAAITDSFSFTQGQSRAEAARKMYGQLPPGTAAELLCTSENRLEVGPEGLDKTPAPKSMVPKQILGEAFVAAAAWQCIAACDLIRQNEFAAANVGIAGANQQAIGARFVSPTL